MKPHLVLGFSLGVIGAVMVVGASTHQPPDMVALLSAVLMGLTLSTLAYLFGYWK